MAKWPNVPHCYGWLALDARGAFRMRDEAAQAAKAAGDVIRHPTLLSFIHRNYLPDEHGAWYFQNGPQRVYVELEATPYIARTTPAGKFITQDNEPLSSIDAAWMTEEGRLVLQGSGKLAMVDDRDLADCAGMLRIDGTPVDDDALLAWLERMQGELQLNLGGRLITITPVRSDELGKRLGFDSHPARRHATKLNAASPAPASSPDS